MTDEIEVSYLKAHRVKPLTKRQHERVDELIDRYAVDYGGTPMRLGGIPRVHYTSYAYGGKDGGIDIKSETDIDIEMPVATADMVRAASEFRACGFVVVTSGDMNIFNQ